MNDSETFDQETPVDEAEDRGKAVDEWVLAYLICPQDAAKAFLGALLITDARGRPLHFAYVLPVRPTPMQRILYGATLNEHVMVDVIVKNLFGDGLGVKPDVVFVDSDALLNARQIVDTPIARLSRPKETQTDGASLSMFNYETGGRADDQEVVGRIVASLEQQIDLLDPFSRMNEALKKALKSENT